MKRYSFHIIFSDGSNPYVHFPCDKKLHNAELRKWRKLYTMKETGRSKFMDIATVNYYAVRNVPTPQLNLFMR